MACVTWRRVSPGPAGLGRGVLVAPGFRHAESFGDTKYVFCVMERRIDVHKCIVKRKVDEFYARQAASNRVVNGDFPGVDNSAHRFRNWIAAAQ